MATFRHILILISTPLFVNCIPEQVHTAFLGIKSTDRTISWSTPNQTETSVVQYWLDGEQSSDAKTASSSDQVEYLHGYGFHHHVQLVGLAEDSLYHYIVGDTADGFSDEFTFQTQASNTTQVQVAILGDWGYLNSSVRDTPIPVGGLKSNWTASYTHGCLSRLVDSKTIDSVFLLGDISYADDSFGKVGDLFQFTYEGVYSAWMNWIQSIASKIPFMVAPGNHESECHSPACVLHPAELGLKLNNFTAYNARWRMPSRDSGGVLNMWYSWRQGNVHFTSMNTETDFEGAGEEDKGDSGIFPAGHFGVDGQYLAWLEADLKAASEDPTIDWIVAGGHRWKTPDLGPNVTDLFKQYGVDLYLAGHAHSYSRYPVGDDGTLHIVVGGAGNDEHEYPDDEGSDTVQCSEWCARASRTHALHEAEFDSFLSSIQLTRTEKEERDLCALCTQPDPDFFTDQYAMGLLTVDGKTLTWTLLRSEDDYVLDQVTLSK